MISIPSAQRRAGRPCVVRPHVGSRVCIIKGEHTNKTGTVTRFTKRMVQVDFDGPHQSEEQMFRMTSCRILPNPNLPLFAPSGVVGAHRFVTVPVVGRSTVAPIFPPPQLKPPPAASTIAAPTQRKPPPAVATRAKPRVYTSRYGDLPGDFDLSEGESYDNISVGGDTMDPAPARAYGATVDFKTEVESGLESVHLMHPTIKVEGERHRDPNLAYGPASIVQPAKMPAALSSEGVVVSDHSFRIPIIPVAPRYGHFNMEVAAEYSEESELDLDPESESEESLASCSTSSASRESVRTPSTRSDDWNPEGEEASSEGSVSSAFTVDSECDSILLYEELLRRAEYSLELPDGVVVSRTRGCLFVHPEDPQGTTRYYLALNSEDDGRGDPIYGYVSITDNAGFKWALACERRDCTRPLRVLCREGLEFISDMSVSQIFGAAAEAREYVRNFSGIGTADRHHSRDERNATRERVEEVREAPRNA